MWQRKVWRSSFIRKCGNINERAEDKNSDLLGQWIGLQNMPNFLVQILAKFVCRWIYCRRNIYSKIDCKYLGVGLFILFTLLRGAKKAVKTAERKRKIINVVQGVQDKDAMDGHFQNRNRFKVG